MAQRCIIVRLARPLHDGTWERDTLALIEAERWAMIGDILAELRKPAAQLQTSSRWGTWENEVLNRVDKADECLREVRQRQGEVDEDAAEADLVREAFIEELRRRWHCPEADVDPDAGGGGGRQPGDGGAQAEEQGYLLPPHAYHP